MSQQNLVVLILYGITILQLDVISSTSEWKYTHETLNQFTDASLDDRDTSISLLPDTGGNRYRRAAADVAEAKDLQRGYTRNPKDDALNKLLDNVDISEDKFKKGIDESMEMKEDDNDATKYYSRTFLNDGSPYFMDLDKANESDFKGQVQEHAMLSKSYRRAATVVLNFSFPFYGHEVKNITIATGGFLYTGDYVHSWLAATQYIAPLMANFDTSNNKDAKIRYLDTGYSFIVEWKDVYLQDKKEHGPFTFQVHLNHTGDIHFAYQKIPLAIQTIQDEEHPVKVGLSDAYIIDRTIFFVKRKTIYEYHRVNMKGHNISDHTAILFKALFTCNQQINCTSCLKGIGDGDKRTNLGCGWCPELSRCSDGMDRKRQEWLSSNCNSNQITDVQMCEVPSIQDNAITIGDNASQQTARSANSTSEDNSGSRMSASSIATIVFFILLVFTLLGWTGYAYFFPHTSSGQFLIRNRPGAWRWRMGGARYTAASSIHM